MYCILGIMFCYAFAPFVSVFASCVLFMFALIPVLPCLSLPGSLPLPAPLRLVVPWICPNSPPWLLPPSALPWAPLPPAHLWFLPPQAPPWALLPLTYLSLTCWIYLWFPYCTLQCNLSSTSSLWSLSSTITTDKTVSCWHQHSSLFVFSISSSLTTWHCFVLIKPCSWVYHPSHLQLCDKVTLQYISTSQKYCMCTTTHAQLLLNA